MKKIGIITYNHRHLKTEQVIHNIALQNNEEVELIMYALPYQEKKKREVVFQHRPNQESGIYSKELASKLNLKFIEISQDSEIDNHCDIYVITGAGILSKACVENKKIINCHPGLIPISRGLDSFKWSIYHFRPIGNTLHYIDEETDSGEVLSIMKTPLYPSDTIETFARRHYEYEINMLSNFNDYIHHPIFDYHQLVEEPVTKRMPNEIEKDIYEYFSKYKKKFIEDM